MVFQLRLDPPTSKVISFLCEFLKLCKHSTRKGSFSVLFYVGLCGPVPRRDSTTSL